MAYIMFLTMIYIIYIYKIYIFNYDLYIYINCGLYRNIVLLILNPPLSPSESLC